MLTLLMLSLESNPPGAAVESIRIEIQPRIPRPAQSDMFLPPAPAPDRLQTTIARLAALCGPGNVGALMPENSHRPEAVRLDPYDPPPPTPVSSSNGAHPRNGAATAAASNAARLVLRAIRPAMEVEVMSSRSGPEFVRGPNLGARVVSIAGPWRRDGEWWKCAGEEPRPSGAAGFIRDYYELALDDGGVYRAFCDLNSNRWFVDGVYD